MCRVVRGNDKIIGLTSDQTRNECAGVISEVGNLRINPAGRSGMQTIPGSADAGIAVPTQGYIVGASRKGQGAEDSDNEGGGVNVEFSWHYEIYSTLCAANTPRSLL